ncbi:MAG: proprotein convertase P-domain-containing protein [Deltaproteobacteria bacterium]|nr:proprotein convertase P-domain-containing protein [Deltaproteobacteria bacterium]
MTDRGAEVAQRPVELDMRASITALAAVSLFACSADDRSDAVIPELGDGKGDAIDHVEDLGTLELEAARTGRFTEDLEFHGYHLSVREGARVRIEITRQGTAKALDTTLFVFGPRQGEAFGDTAIAFDDDAGWGRQSRITGLTLAAGEYLVVVGTHDARGRGAYRLSSTCENGDCAPLPPAPAGCDETVANNILACMNAQVADSAADPESQDLTPAEALAICTDGEALGPVFDRLCEAPMPAAFCAAGFEAFAQEMGPACFDELSPFAVQCVFGDQYHDLRSSHDVVSGPRVRLQSPAGLSELQRAQVVEAVRSSAHTDVTDVDDAFSRADEGEINRTELWDRTSARAYVVYEFGAGDTSVGAYFPLDAAERVAVISDGEIERCSAGVGSQGQDCSSNADCAEGTCVGSSEASNVGRCTVLSGFGEQTECSASAPCDLGQGLMCAGLTRGDEGLCLPAWMVGNFADGSFETSLDLAIPDGDAQGLSRSLLVYGLATVDMDVEIDLQIDHANPQDLRVTLTNPAGNEVLVAQDQADLFRFHAAPVGFSGDESVNGEWTLRVVDAVAGNTGVLGSWTLRIGSRFD